MPKLLRYGAAASLLAVASGIASPAFAAQTVAGSTITNNVSVSYKVGGVTQNATTASDTFTVDRKVNLTVVEEGNSTTSVSPGQPAAVTSFLVSNLSNAPVDILLAATNLTGDNFDVSNFKIYVDTDNSGGYTAGDTLVTYLDQIAAETSNIRVLVVADIPLGQTTNQVANIRLTGTAADALNAGTAGTALVQTAGANTTGVDTVFADTNANGNTARDGIDFAQDSYTVLTAALTATKTSRIISDPLNLTTNPKAIPGATIEYCISVNNSAGTTASAIDISDTLPTTTTYDPSFGVKVNGTTSAGTCTAGASSGAYASGVVTGTIPSVAVGETRNVVFRVLIN